MLNALVKCSKCEENFTADIALTVCPKCEGALLFNYDLTSIAERIPKNTLAKSKNTFWKFLDLLPLSSPKNIVSLGEPYTPVLRLSKSRSCNFKNVYIKDDGRLPTGTFKARGMAVAVSCLKELGIKLVAMPSAGNAAAALAAYGAKAGMGVYVFMPKDVPESNLKECAFADAEVYLVNGLINDAARIVKNLEQKYRWFDISTNKQPYRFEGYKAMAFEIAEQFGWDLPDGIVFPTGGGEGVIGLWKGFKELRRLGWTEKIPRLIVVQSSGCAPFVKAYERNQSEIEEAWKNAETIAAGLRVPQPYASYLTLRAIKETEGMAVAVEDEEIISSMKILFKEGIYACPEAASTLTALERIGNEGLIHTDAKLLLYLTGSAMKYFDVIEIKKEIKILEKDVTSL
ncbi:MAG: threonine synthase [Candidatus Bathyarchaeota archaeon]|nr:MAG: threonine synthase [Candidatus Bathyarchaeota archaeon]